MALLFLGLMPEITFSQEYIRALQIAGSGNDYINGVARDSQGNIIISGTFQYTADFDPSDNEVNLEAATINDIYLAKYSPTGEYIWAKQMSVGSPQRLRNDADDNIYLTGYTLTELDLDPSEGEAIVNADQKQSVFLAKYNSQGEYIWGFAVQSLNGASISSFDLEIDEETDHVYMVGTCSDTMDFDPSENTYNLVTQNDQDLFIAKYTLDGEFVWVKGLHFQGYGYGYQRTISLDNTGNFYIGGSFTGTLDMDPGEGTYYISSYGEFNEDAYLAKYNSSGEVLWAFPLGSQLLDGIWTVRYYDEKVYAVGSFTGTVDFDPSAAAFEMTSSSEIDENGFLAVYNDDGSFNKAMGMIGAENSGNRVHDMRKDPDGNIYLLGSFYGTLDADPSGAVQNITTNGVYDMFIAKYSTDGAYIWAEHYGGTEQEQAYFLQLAGNTHVLTFGYFDGNCDFNPSDESNVLYNKGGHDVYMAWYTAYPGSSVAEQVITETINIYPNPSGHDCEVQLELLETTVVNFGVTDLNGREIIPAAQILLKKGSQIIKIPSRQFAPGVYFVWEETGGRKYIQKLVKIR